MTFSVQQARKNRSWTKILLEESEYSLRERAANRATTFRRMYMSVFVLFGAGFLIYCSFFYASAFLGNGRVVGVTQGYVTSTSASVIALPSGKETPGFLDKFKYNFTQNRAYLRAGQSMTATYVKPSGYTVHFKVRQCRNAPVLEVVNCKFVGEQIKRSGAKNSGVLNFRVSEPGFYFFEETIVKNNGARASKQNVYRITWQRN